VINLAQNRGHGKLWGRCRAILAMFLDFAATGAQTFVHSNSFEN
jgi:hypothetical protein